MAMYRQVNSLALMVASDSLNALIVLYQIMMSLIAGVFFNSAH